MDFTRRYAEVPVTRKFDTVVTSAAGYPLDKTYYQTVKGMVGPLDILNPDGHLIIAASCEEGIGSPEYIAAQQRLLELGGSGFLQAIRQKSHADIDEWQTQMQLKPMQLGHIHLYSDNLSPEQQRLTGVNPVASLDATLARCLAASRDRALAVIPEGPYVIPRYCPGGA